MDKLTTMPNEGKEARERDFDNISGDGDDSSDESDADTEQSQRQAKITEENPSSGMPETPLGESHLVAGAGGEQ